MLPLMTVEMLPQTPAFSTFLELVTKAVFPKQFLEIFSFVEVKKFSPSEQEALKTMAIETIVKCSTELKDVEIAQMLKKFDIEVEQFHDDDYKFHSLVSVSDLEVFD